MTTFTQLSSPFNIGTMVLKNRMVMSPMTTAYCNDDQTPSERLIRYFEERAKGGVGLITMELITIDEVHRYLHRSMTLATRLSLQCAGRNPPPLLGARHGHFEL